MNILLIGEVFSHNLGDAVICQTEKRILEEQYTNATITLFDMSGKTGFNEHYQFKGNGLKQKLLLKAFALYGKVYPKSHLYKAYMQDDIRHVRMLGMLDTLCKKQKFDLVIFAGGELFMDYFAGIIYLIVKKLKKCKIIFHACGMGELNNFSIDLLKRVFSKSNVFSISLRDSYHKFSYLFGTKKVVGDTYDIALNCNKYYMPSKNKIAQYGIGVIDQDKYYLFQKNLIGLFMESEKTWKIFVNGAKSDENVARNILNEFGIHGIAQDKYIVKRPVNDKELIDTVTQFESIVSFRMHSQIIASAFGIPSYGIVWDEKVKTYFEKIGMPNNYCIPEKNIDSLNFLKILEIDQESLVDTIEIQAEASKELLINEIEKILLLLRKENRDS